MISDAKQRRLDEIERLPRHDDPRFVQPFDRTSHTPRTGYTVVHATSLAALAILAVPAVTALAGALGGPIAAIIAVWVMTTACVVVVVLRRHRAQPPRCWR